MTHASLYKRTYQCIAGLQATTVRFMRSRAIIALLFAVCASILSAQSQFVITTTSLPNAVVETPYNQQVQQSGAEGTVTWSIISGSLPPGLTLNANSGVIGGTPTSVGYYAFEVQAEYNESAPQDATQNLSISVQSPCTPAVSPSSSSPLPTGEVGVAYTQVTFTTSGCSSSFTFSAQQIGSSSQYGVPPGLNVSSSGTLTGTPTTAGSYTFVLNVTDQNQNTTQFQYSMTIAPQPTLTTQSPLPSGLVGIPYSQQITATGGVPPYVFDMNANPPGITITQAGVLNGTPTKAGTYTFNIGVMDSLNVQTVGSFQVTFASPVSELQVTPLNLTFNANVGGSPPPPQTITLTPATGTTPPVTFQVVVDSGQANSAQPSWITVSPTAGSAPAGVVVSVDQSTLSAGTYTARVQLLDADGIATAVAITLNVASTPQKLTVAPATLNFTARAATASTLVQTLVVGNSGDGSLGFTTSVLSTSPWITSVTSSASSTTRNAPVYVQVQVSTNGLQVGAYQGVVLISSAAGNIQVPVSLFIAGSGPAMSLDSTGVLFQAIVGGGSTDTETVNVLNFGDPSSTVNWTATLLSGSNWLTLPTSSGTATTTMPGTLSLALASNATQLTPGPYYAIVQVADPNSLNSPQYITVVLDLEPSTALPAPDPAAGGLYFTSVGGSTTAPTQQLQVNTSSTSAVTFTAAATTTTGSSWLNVAPSSGSISGQSPAMLTVSANPTGLAAGIYSGEVSVSIGGALQSVNITYVVQPTTVGNGDRFRPKASGCSASKLAITETSLPNNFAIPAGWPQTLIVQLNDDCGGVVTGGNVVASFSNGDQALKLVSDSLGNYSATWQPGTSNSNMVITLNATSGSLTPATAKLSGGVAPNQTPPPTVAPGGTLNNLNPVTGAALAPGTIAQVFGSGLAASSVSTGVLPLPTTFDNTFALVGSKQAPLYFLSSGQVNIQIPSEITASQQIPIILSVNNALTLPAMLNIVPNTPGVLSELDGPTPPSVQNGAHIIAQHSADFSLVSSSSPAKPGEFLIMYLVGMGATNPSVASGTPAPSSTLSQVTAQPTVTVGSQPATIQFAGLTPGFVGLYQVNFQVPSGVSSGELEVDVTQNGVAANPTLLPVSSN